MTNLITGYVNLGTDANGNARAIGITDSGAMINNVPVFLLAVDAAVPPLNVGVGGAAVTSADASAAPVAVTDAPGVGKRLMVSHLIISVDTAGIIVNLTEETTGVLKARIYTNANSPALSSADIDLPLATPNKRLMLQTNKAGNIAVTVLWYAF